MNGAAVRISRLSKDYGKGLVLSDINLNVEAGEFLTLLGPSGCGKSTLLRLIAGFETPAAGTLEIGSKRVDGLRPKERGLSMVFQNYALYPHMSVFDNIATPLVMRNLSFAQRFPLVGPLWSGSAKRRADIRKRVAEVAQLLEIDELLDRKPGQLSGGQRQRVALGRAIAPEPCVFLMDEPLSNLDARLRLQMRSELTDLHRRLGATFIYVTHDQVEAMAMSQRVAVMMDGRVVQIGTPSEIYRLPAELRVATFIGTHPINVCAVRAIAPDAIQVLGQTLCVGTQAAQIATLAFRPEEAELGGGHRSGSIAFDVELERIEDHGSEMLVHAIDRESDHHLHVSIPASQRHRLNDKNALRFGVPVASLHGFDRDGYRIDGIRWGSTQQSELTRLRM